MTPKFTKRFWIVLAICASCTLSGVGLFSLRYSPLMDAETYTEDLRARLGRKTAPDDQLVLIGIDRTQYDPASFSDDAFSQVPVLRHLTTPYPWSRELWAEVINRLAEAGAKVIVIDVIFEASRPEDEALHGVLEKHRDRVVIGYEVTNQKTPRGNIFSWRLPSASVISISPGSHPIEDQRLGYVTVWADDDDVVRHGNYRLRGSGVGDPMLHDSALESLAARALRQAGRANLIPEGFEEKQLRFTAPPGKGFQPHPIGDVLSPRLWERNYSGGQYFRDKIVLIGPTAEIFQDAHRIPLTAEADAADGHSIVLKGMPGPELHLNMLNAALQGEFLSRTTVGMLWWLTACAGMLAAGLGFALRPPVRRLLVLGAVCTAYWYSALWLFNRGGTIVPLTVPLLVLVVGSVLILVYDVVLERLERMKLRHTMGLYFSPRVLDAVLADPGSMKPRRADVTLLLTDLRNSTPLAEALGPQGMFQLLNRVFEVQTSAIMSEEGNLEHFLGDQFLSYWGAPQPQPDAADRAERAAVILINAMEGLRASLAPPVAELFGYGVALHSGSVLVGNKGSALRLDYGLVGDTVNEAARIESLTKYYGLRLLVSRETFAQFSRQSTRRLVDRVIVKGKTEPVELFECENPCVPRDYAGLCGKYKAAYDDYFFARFVEAEKQFAALAREYHDGPSRVLAERCAMLACNPPSAWNGVWKLESK